MCALVSFEFADYRAQASGLSASCVRLPVSVSLPRDKLGIRTCADAVNLAARYSAHIHRTVKLRLPAILPQSVHYHLPEGVFDSDNDGTGSGL